MSTNARIDSQTLHRLSQLNELGLIRVSEICRTLRSLAHEPAESKVESQLQLVLEELTDLLDELIYVRDHLFGLKRQLPMRERILHQARPYTTRGRLGDIGLLSQLDLLEKTLRFLPCAPLSRQASRFLRHNETVCKALLSLRNDIADALLELGQTSTTFTVMSPFPLAN